MVALNFVCHCYQQIVRLEIYDSLNEQKNDLLKDALMNIVLTININFISKQSTHVFW